MPTLTQTRPIVFAGPCMAESFDIMQAALEPLQALSKELGFDYYFKASFDKANRTSIDSFRGPGLKQACRWFQELKERYGCRILTDIHETHQVEEVAEVCEVLQIPAFLCRQTDLLVAAIESGRMVNIKKGQFMAPQAMAHIVGKARAASQPNNFAGNVTLTERGSSFGYGDLVVDMRSFAIMAKEKIPLIFDITHSTQQPASGGGVSGALRAYAPLLARAATATGYLSGFFLEVHPEPKEAKSDAAAQLDIKQASLLLRQIIPLWYDSQRWSEIDKFFI